MCAALHCTAALHARSTDSQGGDLISSHLTFASLVKTCILFKHSIEACIKCIYFGAFALLSLFDRDSEKSQALFRRFFSLSWGHLMQFHLLHSFHPKLACPKPPCLQKRCKKGWRATKVKPSWSKTEKVFVDGICPGRNDFSRRQRSSYHGQDSFAQVSPSESSLKMRQSSFLWFMSTKLGVGTDSNSCATAWTCVIETKRKTGSITPVYVNFGFDYTVGPKSVDHLLSHCFIGS